MRFFEEFFKLDRLNYLIRIRGTGPAHQLAEKLDVCPRTTRRMLKYLREEGFPIEYDPADNTYYYTKPVPRTSIFVVSYSAVRYSNSDGPTEHIPHPII